ncbi:hypothetical protein GGR56DRAFT_623052 [Xylariaceae sp. FL0804]|nr:hypothetical protein GGR56DRAFT_623052 [Xylariaceae sp. FL0804]
MTAPEVSHGRGGAGNINPDDTKYVDGEIVRQGEAGPHGDGAFSTGRGGAANIGDAEHRPTSRLDADVVPEQATRSSLEGDFHTGRGGAANVVHVGPEDAHAKTADGASGTTTPNAAATPDGRAQQNVGLADKLKHKLFGAFKK